jgi:hypothetical protein
LIAHPEQQISELAATVLVSILSKLSTSPATAKAPGTSDSSIAHKAANAGTIAPIDRKGLSLLPQLDGDELLPVDQALVLLRHQEMPVRVCGLRELARTIRAMWTARMKNDGNRKRTAIMEIDETGQEVPMQTTEDSEEVSMLANLMDVLYEAALASLHDLDSFMYLSAIECIEDLIDLNAVKYFPIVLELFRDSSLSAEARVKVGEGLTRGCQRLGAMMQVWMDRLIDEIMVTCQDPNPLVRCVNDNTTLHSVNLI